MTTEFPVTIKFNTDKASLKKAEKEVSKTGNKKSGGGGAAFAGGFLGSIAGELLKSVKALFDPISAIAGLLIGALFPILKPFLILFIKVGLLLFRWLQQAMSGLGAGTETSALQTNEQGILQAGDKLKSALFIIGAIVAGIVAALLGAPATIIAAVALLGGLLFSKVGAFFVDTFLGFVQWIDSLFGTNFIQPLSMFFEGIANVFQGLYNTLINLVSLDFAEAWEGLKQVFLGAWQILKGVLGTLWESLKQIVLQSFKGLSTLGSWIWDSLVAIFKPSFEALRNIGSWISDKIKGFFSSLNPFSRGSSSRSVNDAIITPNGDVIRTNPSDYLIATKTPESLGGGGGSSNVNVTINGGLITEEVAREIGQVIQRELNLGGRF